MSSAMRPIELISFKLCPFVQRSVITLNKKGIDYKITYIDLADKPDWFLKISPLGKVPVVKYGDDVLFESAVINEFLDEITPEQIMPQDPLQKAKDRGWIEYLSQVTMNQYMLMTADSQEAFETHKISLTEKLLRLENTVSADGFFNGSEFSLVDSAFAPVLTRLDLVKRFFNFDLLADMPRLQALSALLINQDYVKKSVVEEFDEIMHESLKNNNSYLTA
ncbi:glutathione S-transferase family protein [Psychromonas ossibalaenae]|uniref:glutathione S-transferase family protein n=1 Tax=Psychromonas ossibalaenae TaxID=444922 RepID=UPI00036F7D28|nr:glutathione S-transferase family protein [Psychromonas ossibalaenae]